MAEIQFSWDWSLITLSYVNACMGAWIGVSLLCDARRHIKNMKYYLLCILLASIGFGLCGVWTMHYTGMLAHKCNHVKVSYNIGLVVLSAVLPVLLVFGGFTYVGIKIPITEKDNATDSLLKISFRKPQKNELIHCFIAGLIIALGVCTMHYTGMAAVIINASQKWQAGIVVLSVIIAIAVSFVGVVLLLFIDGLYGQLVSCLVIGFAVCTMHYAGMYAVIYYENNDTILISTNENDFGFTFTAHIISTISGCVVSILLICYNILQFYQYKNTNFYQKRLGNIIIATNFFSLLYIVFGTTNLIMRESQGKFKYVTESLLSFAFYGLLSSLLLRYILSWFTINWLSAKENMSWQTILNSKLTEMAKTSFFFVNYMKYGNIKWLSQRIYLIFAIIWLAEVVTVFLVPNNVRLVFVILVTVCTVILILYFVYNTPSGFNDLLFIFWEMKFIVFILLIMSLSTLVSYFIIDDSINFNIYYTFQTMIGLTIIAIIPIQIVLNQQKLQKINGRKSKNTLGECLSDMGLFEAFILHLNKEFAMEVLLFQVEATQWKDHFQELLRSHVQSENNNSPTVTPNSPNVTLCMTPNSESTKLNRISMTTLTIDKDVHIRPRFANDMPLSVIVYGHNKDEIETEKRIIRQCKESAYLLYTKYILSGSEFEVNISYGVRSKLHGLMSSYIVWMEENAMSSDAYVLLQIFDDSVIELYRLLEHSFNRFNKTRSM